MNVIGVTQNEQYQIFRLLSAILWLGNVTFYEASQDQAAVADTSVVDMVAYLLEVDSHILQGVFATRLMETTRAGQRATTYNVPLNVPQATSVRDALSKTIYDKLFDWIVERVNKAMHTNNANRLLLGVLDIYGFEIFDVTILFSCLFFFPKGRGGKVTHQTEFQYNHSTTALSSSVSTM